VTLIDTSVVIDYARGKDARVAALLPTVAGGVCGVVRAELLCGARDAKHRASLSMMLAPFQHVPIGESIWDALGDNLARLRRAGVTVPFSDAIIATVAIENAVDLWARDQQFLLIQKVLPALRLFQEPP
jgi:predicted nucleic acid-binding protein